MKKRATEKMKKLPVRFRMMGKGVYTAQARALARLMVATGTAEEKVGVVLKEIGRNLGVEVGREMSKRTVGRAVLEGGIAGDIQLAYEMVQHPELSYSSDSTSHKHIEFDSRTIALEVADYLNDDAPHEWRLRTLGVAMTKYLTRAHLRSGRSFNSFPKPLHTGYWEPVGIMQRTKSELMKY